MHSPFPHSHLSPYCSADPTFFFFFFFFFLWPGLIKYYNEVTTEWSEHEYNKNYYSVSLTISSSEFCSSLLSVSLNKSSLYLSSLFLFTTTPSFPFFEFFGTPFCLMFINLMKKKTRKLRVGWYGGNTQTHLFFDGNFVVSPFSLVRSV